MAKKQPVAGPSPSPRMAPASPKSWAAAAASAIGSARAAMSKTPGPSTLHRPPPMTNALRGALQEWIDGQFDRVGTRHKFRPILNMQGHMDDDFAADAVRYRFDIRADLMTHEGQELKAPKVDDLCVSYSVHHGAPFPFDEIAEAFRKAIVEQIPRWRERYDNRLKVDDDDGMFPTIMWPPAVPMAPLKVPPHPALYGAPSSYVSEYHKAMSEAKMKIDTSQLYGYAPRKASLVWDPAVDGKP